jgi:type IV pilus assembly protein PilX
MIVLPKNRSAHMHGVHRQRGATLFVALIALVTIMLAAVSLMRASDTSTIVAGNLAFKQAATSAGDGGLESAMATLTALNAAQTTSPTTDPAHKFNNTDLTKGYYSYIDPALSLTADATWLATASGDAGHDAGDNYVRFIIQRMCRTSNGLAIDTDCIFSDDQIDKDSHGNPHQAVKSGKNTLMRVTVRVSGPRNTVSYIQAFIY